MEFVYPILIFVVMGIVFGVLLVVISKVFAVKTDERAHDNFHVVFCHCVSHLQSV